jgi:hypothetical protein
MNSMLGILPVEGSAPKGVQQLSSMGQETSIADPTDRIILRMVPTREPQPGSFDVQATPGDPSPPIATTSVESGGGSSWLRPIGSSSNSPVSGYLSNESSGDGQLGFLFSSLPLLNQNTSSNTEGDDPDGDPSLPTTTGAHGHKAAGPKGNAPGWLQQLEMTRSDENETRKILMRMFADTKKADMEIWQMMRDMQTYIYGCMEASMLNQAKARSKAQEGWLKYISG